MNSELIVTRPTGMTDITGGQDCGTWQKQTMGIWRVCKQGTEHYMVYLHLPQGERGCLQLFRAAANEGKERWGELFDLF